jgi:hypothetical protein
MGDVDNCGEYWDSSGSRLIDSIFCFDSVIVPNVVKQETIVGYSIIKARGKLEYSC